MKIGALWGLSGAAAQGAGLALLGGGSLAAGGFGVIGGAAILASLSTFTSLVVSASALDYLSNKFNEASFDEKSKNFVNVPFPTNKDGKPSYTNAMEAIGNIKPDEPIWSTFNTNVLNLAKQDVSADSSDLPTMSLSSLISLNMREYDECTSTSKSVINALKKEGVPPEQMTFPIAINIICRLGIKETNSEAIEYISNDLYIVLRNEINKGKEQYLLLWLAAFLDRYINRNDLLDDRLFRKMLPYATDIQDAKVQYQYVMFISFRFNLKLNEYASIIEFMYINRANKTVYGNPDASDYLLKIGKTYQDLAALAPAVDSMVAILNPKYNYNYGTRHLLHKTDISDDEKMIATLRESLIKHYEMAPKTQDWIDEFIEAAKKE